MNNLITIENPDKLSNLDNVEYFIEQINKIEEFSQNNLYILFNEKKFVKNAYIINPLFWVFFFNFYEKNTQKRIVLDITHLPYKTQFIIISHLKQYIDYKIIDLDYDSQKTSLHYLDENSKYYQNTIRNYFNVDGEIRIKYSTKYEYYEGILPSLLNLAHNPELLKSKSPDQVLKYYDNNENEQYLNASDYDFVEQNTENQINVNINYLPILNITNRNFSDITLNIMDDKEGYLASLYEEIQIEYDKDEYKTKEVWNNIFEKYLNITNNDHSTLVSFKKIIIEMVSNILQHTNQQNTNGYISFYKNTQTQLNEFYICDNYSNGFLDSYLLTMEEELKTELKINPNSKAKKRYKEIIKDLRNKNYQTVLENIFSLDYILDVQSERIKKHFGMPILLKLLQKFNTQPTHIVMFVNDKSGESYRVYYADSKATVKKLKYPLYGTYLYISFPINSQVIDSYEKDKKPLILNTSNYNQLFLDQTIIKQQRKKFKYVKLSELESKIRLSENQESIIVKYDNEFNLSEFLRKIYIFAYLKDVKDILVINCPLDENNLYIDILLETTNVKEISNILFLNDIYPKALFIGGESDDELESINYKLSKTYNYNQVYYGTKTPLNKDNINISIDSNLFYVNSKKEQNLIPFELFLSKKEQKMNQYLYMKMIDNFLNLSENYEDIHLDLTNGIHLKKFYYLKHIFENSQWVDLIAFDLARNVNLITDENKSKNIILVGIEKYSSTILSITQQILGSDYQVYIIENMSNDIVIEMFNNFVEKNKNSFYIFFRPTIFEFYNENKKNKLLKGIDEKDKKFISVIKLLALNHIADDWDTLHTKDLKEENIIEHIFTTNKQDVPFCSLCFPKDKYNKNDFSLEKPIYKIDEDKYNIKNLYKDIFTISEKKLETQVSWKNCIYFGHTYRKTNHYLYYIKTIQFLTNNLGLIKSYFNHSDMKDINEEHKISIILTPNHNTNSEFTALINNIVFNNNAIVHTFSLDYKEQVFYSIKHYNELYEGKSDFYNFYFVDDEISSGDTLEYFNNILKQINNTTDVKFKAIFTLIDRTTHKDKKNILNLYYKDNSFYSFVKLHIHPIKTGFEECYLCKRVDYLKNISEDSSLAFIKHEYLSKIKTGDKRAILELKKSDEIEYDEVDEYSDFKNYLKLYATEYIYEKLDQFEDIDNELKIFLEYVYEYFEIHYLKNAKRCTDELKTIIDFEAKIAFIKSLSFPKVLFHRSIKDKVHEYIFKELYQIIIDEKTGEVKNLDDGFIKDKLTEMEYHKLKAFTNLSIIDIFKDKNKTNVDEFNFLLSIASYLGINFIMSEEMINFYFKLTKLIKDDDPFYKKYKMLLGIYPIAIKQITYYSHEKSEYFNTQLSSFYNNNKFQYTRQFSRIFGLYVENSLFIKENDRELIENIENTYDDLKTIEENIKDLILKLELFLKNENFGKYNKQNIKILNFYVNINQDKQNPKVISILDYDKEAKDESYELEMIKGAHSIKDTKANIPPVNIKHNPHEKPYNIWCNFLKNNKTYVRLTDTKLNPVGVIVLEHRFDTKIDEHEKLLVHLKISRRILLLQNIIIQIFRKNEIISSIRDTVNIRVENKTKLIKSSHGAAGDINNALVNLEDSNELYINLWKAHCNTYIGNMYLDEDKKKHNISEINQYQSFTLNKLIKYISLLNKNRSVEIEFNISEDDIKKFQVKEIYINIFLSLLIDNAIKHSSFMPKIRLYSIDNIIIVENNRIINKNINCKDINKNIKIEPYKISDNQGITLFTINKYLNSINCYLVVDYENEYLKVKIIKE